MKWLKQLKIQANKVPKPKQMNRNQYKMIESNGNNMATCPNHTARGMKTIS